MISAVLIFIVVLLFLNVMIREDRTVNISGKISTNTVLHGKWLVWPCFISNIRKNKVCHGESNARRAKIVLFSVLSLTIFSFGSWLNCYPSLNVWDLNKHVVALKVPLPVVWKQSNTDVMLLSDWLATALYYFTITPLQLCLLNRISLLHKVIRKADKGRKEIAISLFPHSERAKAVEEVVLADEVLPNFYKAITQINQNQVVVDYSGNSIDAQIFITRKRQLSEGLHYMVDVQLGSTPGIVVVTYKTPYRIDPSEWWDKPDSSGIIKSPEKREYVYGIFTGALVSGKREIKLGRATDLDRRFSEHKTSMRSPKWLFALPVTRELNENVLKEMFADYKLSRRPGDDSGEFYAEKDDGFYEVLDAAIVKSKILPELKKYQSSEVLERI